MTLKDWTTIALNGPVQMTARAVTGIVSFGIAGTCLVLANIFLTMMIGEINRKRQDGDLVSYFGFTFPKVKRIVDEYLRSYPMGKLYLLMSTAFIVAIVGLITAMVCIGIIG